MFQIHTYQLALLERMAVAEFEEQMIAHCAAFSPRLAAAPGREGLASIVRAAIARAAGHGFTLQGPVRLFIELGFLFGTSFDADVQYPWARAGLARSGEIGPAEADFEQIDRAAELHRAAVDALSAIRGPGDRYIGAARRRLLDLAAKPSPSQVDDLPAFVLSALERVHPEKYAFVGEPALRELVAAGADEAARYGLHAPRDVLLLVALMFAYGQGCTSDPIHAWIARALTDEATATPALRARRLEEAALMIARDALAGAVLGQ